jgi:flagellar hook-length control protein FliK
MSAADDTSTPVAPQQAAQQTPVPMDQSSWTLAYGEHDSTDGAAWAARNDPAAASSATVNTKQFANGSADATSDASANSTTPQAASADATDGANPSQDATVSADIMRAIARHAAMTLSEAARGANATAIAPQQTKLPSGAARGAMTAQNDRPAATNGATTVPAANTPRDATSDANPRGEAARTGAAVGSADASTGSASVAANDLSAAIASTTPEVTTKTRSDGGDGDHGDDGSATNADGAAAAAASQEQPVAAAIVLGVSLNGTTAAANAGASGTTIGDGTRARGRVALSLTGGQDAGASQNGKDAASAQDAPSANVGTTANTDPASSKDSANTQAANNTAAPQQQTRTDNAATPQLQPGANAPADINHAATPADALTASAAATANGSSSAQAGSGAAKPNADGLPNFGFLPANMAVPSASAPASGTAAAAAVPIAGLAVAITARALAGSNQFDIRLDPPELGRIDVRLDVDSNGQVTSHVTVDRVDTLQLLQSQQPQLERALEQAGLKTADNGLQFTLRDQSFAGQNNSGGMPSNTAQLVIPDVELPAIQSTQSYNRLGLGTGIDIRV